MLYVHITPKLWKDLIFMKVLLLWCKLGTTIWVRWVCLKQSCYPCRSGLKQRLIHIRMWHNHFEDTENGKINESKHTHNMKWVVTINFNNYVCVCGLFYIKCISENQIYFCLLDLLHKHSPCMTKVIYILLLLCIPKNTPQHKQERALTLISIIWI